MSKNYVEQNEKIIKFLHYFVSSEITEELPNNIKSLLVRTFKYHKSSMEVDKYLDKLRQV